MKDVRYLTLDELLVIHDNMVELYGGSFGVRDLGLIQSALARPQATFGGEDLYPMAWDKAAALLQSMTMNHPFLDGNKRTAYETMKRFLYMNGYAIKTSQKEIVRMCVAVDNEGWGIKEIVGWLKKHAVAI